MVHVTAFFAGMLAFIYIGLSVIVINHRKNIRLAIGDGGDALLARKIRAHANFAEYVPLALILMAVNELNGRAGWMLSILGLAIVAARLSHAYSLLVTEVKREDDISFRFFGMVTTFCVITLLALMAIF